MKRAAYAVGALALVAALVLLAAPALIDRPAVQAEIQRRLSEMLQGQVAWEALDVALFPAPHGELRKLRVEIPGKIAAAADDVNVYLRLWPLLRGRVEIASLTLKKPSIRVLAAGGGSDGGPLDVVATYRAAMEPAARALREFAPDMAFKLEEASVEVGPDFALHDVQAAARTDSNGVELQAAAASNLWKRLSLEGRVEYADLSARAAVALDALALDKDVPPAALRAKLRTDGKSAIEGEFDGNLGALVPAAKGRLVAPAGGKPPELSAELSDVDLAQVFAVARLKVAGLDTIESAEGKLSADVSASLGPSWWAQIHVTKSHAAVKLPQLPWKLSAHAAHVTVSGEHVHVKGLRGVVGETTITDAAAQLHLGKVPRLSAASGRATLKLEQWYPWLKPQLPLQGLAALSGTLEVHLKRMALRFDRPADLDFEAVATPRKVSAKLTKLPDAVRLAGGTIHADRKRVRLAGLVGAIGASTFKGVDARIDLGKTPGVSAASGRATIKLDQWLPWLQGELLIHDVAALSGSLDVALKRVKLRFDRPAEFDYDAVATLRNVSMTLKALPGPLGIASGSMSFGRKSARYEKLAVAMLDAKALLSGTATLEGPRVELALDQGELGEKAVQWALKQADVPERFEPKTPLRFDAKRIAWAREGTLEADARIDFDGGPQVALTLASKPKLLELPRIAIKDASSDAVLGLSVAGELVRASFAGTLQGRSIASMLRRPGPETASGSANGKLRLTLHRTQPQQTLADGRLRVEALDLSWLVGMRAIVERMDLIAEATGARIVDARFALEEQVVNLSGEVKRTAQGPVIDARLESPGVVLDRVLPEAKAADKRDKDEKSKLWPLPVTGRIDVRSGFVQYKERRIEPFQGRLSLERERAHIELQEARMCGVSFPMELEAVPEKVKVAAHVSMRDEPLPTAMRCLTGGNVEITGNADVRAELRSEGRRPDLFRNMTGTVEAETRKGSVKRFALIGNILSLRNIVTVSQMNESGFPYRRMTAKGYFKDGNLMLEEGFFDSDAVRLGAHGKVDLVGADSQLAVLVGLFTNVDRITGAIPILGYVFGGQMTALPVGVSGDIRDPRVVPLGPRAVTDSLLGIFERTLKLPGKLVVPAAEAEPGAK